MPDDTPAKKGSGADWFMQGALSRLGDTFDRFTGRGWEPAGSLATSGLIERMKKLLDAEARDVPGKGKVVPHKITLKMQWDKFATDAADTLDTLRTELLVAATDHINDRLYYTYGPLSLDVKTDYFTEGVKINVSFDDFSISEDGVEMDVTIPSFHAELPADETPTAAPVERYLIVRRDVKGDSVENRITIPPSGRISVGRAAGNDLALEDPSVSKVHASLVVAADGTMSVADTGSTNGTFIGGERMAYGRAEAIGDAGTVCFGEVEVSFEMAATEHADVQPIESIPADNEVEFSIMETRLENSEAADGEIRVSDDLKS